MHGFHNKKDPLWLETLTMWAENVIDFVLMIDLSEIMTKGSIISIERYWKFKSVYGAYFRYAKKKPNNLTIGLAGSYDALYKRRRSTEGSEAGGSSRGPSGHTSPVMSSPTHIRTPPYKHHDQYSLPPENEHSRSKWTNFDEIFQSKAYLRNYLKGKCWSEYYQQLSFKYFLKSVLTLLRLRLLLFKAKGPKDFWKSSKPCHVGIHWIALAECSQLSTHVPGFQFFPGFCIILYWTN